MGCLLLYLYRIILGGWQLVPSALGEVIPASRELSEATGGYSTISISYVFLWGSSLPFNAFLALASSFLEYVFVPFLS